MLCTIYAHYPGSLNFVVFLKTLYLNSIAYTVVRKCNSLFFCSHFKLFYFYKESFFQWCFGVCESDCFGAIDVDSGRAILFVPKLPDSYKVWMGEVYSCEHFRAKYAVDVVEYTKDVRFEEWCFNFFY